MMIFACVSGYSYVRLLAREWVGSIYVRGGHRIRTRVRSALSWTQAEAAAAAPRCAFGDYT